MFCLGSLTLGTEVSADNLAPPSVTEVSGAGWLLWAAFPFGSLAQSCASQVLVGGHVPGTEIYVGNLDLGAQTSATEASEMEAVDGKLHQVLVVEVSNDG